MAVKIDSFAAQLGLNVVRSREFGALGYLSHGRPEMLVPFHDAAFRPQLIANAKVAMVLAAPDVAALVPDELGLAIVANPMSAFVKLHMRLAESGFYGAPFPSEIAPDARVHPTAHIDPAEVRIGRGVVVGPKATVLARSTIEDSAIIGLGAVIGWDGYELRT